MNILSLNPYICLIILGFAIFIVPPLLIYFINYLYKNHTSVLTFPEKLSKVNKKKEIMTIIIGTLSILAIPLVILPQTLEMLLLQILFMAIMTLTIVTDLDQQVIFDISNGILAIGGILFIIASDASAMDHLLTGIGAGLISLILAVITRGGLGGGDIKLFAALGLWLGIDGMLATIIFGSILGGFVALFLLITKRVGKKSHFAYGAYFAIAAIFSFILNQIHV